MNELDPVNTPRPGLALMALLVSVPIPTVGVALAAVAYPEATWAKAVWMVGKAWMLAVPVLWLVYIEKGRLRLPRWSNRGMVAGHVTGVLIFLVIGVTYLLIADAWIDFALMREKIAAMGLDNPWLYAGGALYWCTVNSLLEEYFWRWFTYCRLRDLLPGKVGNIVAVGLAGLLFTVHHVLALSVYFDWRVTTLASVGVFIGGVTWSALYARYRNIYAAYISHVWADLIIFGLGAWLIFGNA